MPDEPPTTSAIRELAAQIIAAFVRRYHNRNRREANSVHSRHAYAFISSVPGLVEFNQERDDGGR